jgi:seryl-tRNA synthetase
VNRAGTVLIVQLFRAPEKFGDPRNGGMKFVHALEGSAAAATRLP